MRGLDAIFEIRKSVYLHFNSIEFDGIKIRVSDERIESWFELQERGLQFPGVGEAVFGIPDEGFVDDGGEVFLQSGHAVADGDGVFVEDDIDGVALGIEAVGEFPGEELVEGGGEAPDVGDRFSRRRRCLGRSRCRGSGRCWDAGVRR